MRLSLVLAGTVSAAAYLGCSSTPTASPTTGEGGRPVSPESAPSPEPGPSAPPKPFEPVGDPFDVPINGVTRQQVLEFEEGDRLFGLQLRAADGLGPLYTRNSCGACHEEGARGPGFVQKMAVVLADGITPSPDQSKLPFGNTVHPLATAGATTPILPPEGDRSILVTMRIGPPILGRGYMEALADADIEAKAAEQARRTDGIHGRVNHVVYASEPNPESPYNHYRKGDRVIGRFGLKARIATLDEFTADALQGDMGITSPLRPTEFANPDGLKDDAKPGIDLTLASVNKRADYMRLVAIPARRGASVEGRAAFEQAKCIVCHTDQWKTREDYPLRLLAGVEAPLFSDMLLHDMGTTLGDGTQGSDGEAKGNDWRTAPLLGLRFYRNFLHDGRAKTVAEAIEQHDGPGSEAHESIEIFRSLAPSNREALVRYVEGL